MNPLSEFGKEDLEIYKQLDSLLEKNVAWNVSTAQAVQVYRALVWFANLRGKIERLQVSDVKVTAPAAPKPPRSTRSSTKAE